MRHVCAGRFEAPSPPVDGSPWHWVASEADLRAAAAALQGKPCVAVDVEHHAARSYLGITCLLQISDGQQVALLFYKAVSSAVSFVTEQ